MDRSELKDNCVFDPRDLTIPFEVEEVNDKEDEIFSVVSEIIEISDLEDSFEEVEEEEEEEVEGIDIDSFDDEPESEITGSECGSDLESFKEEIEELKQEEKVAAKKPSHSFKKTRKYPINLTVKNAKSIIGQSIRKKPEENFYLFNLWIKISKIEYLSFIRLPSKLKCF